MRFDRRKTYPRPLTSESAFNTIRAIVPRRIGGILKQRGPKKLLLSVNRAVGKIGWPYTWALPALKFTSGGTSPQFGSQGVSLGDDTGGGLPPEFESYPDSLTTEETNALAEFYAAETAAGNFEKYESLFITGLSSPANSLWDPIREVSGNVSSGTPSHVPGKGYLFNAGADAISLALDCSTLIPKAGFAGDNAFWSFFVTDHATVGLVGSTGYILDGSNIDNFYSQEQAGFIFVESMDGSTFSETVPADSALPANTTIIGYNDSSRGAESNGYIKNGAIMANAEYVGSLVSGDIELGSSSNGSFIGNLGIFVLGASEGMDYASHELNLKALAAGLSS